MTTGIGTSSPKHDTVTLSAKVALRLFPGLAALYDWGYRHGATDTLTHGVRETLTLMPVDERYKLLSQVLMLGD